MKSLISLKWAAQKALIPISALGIIVMFTFSIRNVETQKTAVSCCINPTLNQACIMKTILGLDTAGSSVSLIKFETSEKVEESVKKGLHWIADAQGNDGGWGAGTHSHQDIMNPHAVKSDPASTALVAMSLLRTDNTIEKGEYSKNLKEGLEFLLKAVETCPANQPYLTTLDNTQPQVKLGRNIDVILTAQFFTNLLRYEIADASVKKRIEKALDKCVARIEKGQDTDGSWKDGGWAPVLQSALANNALENAQSVGRKVDSVVLNRGYKYQNSNFDVETKSVVTGKAAGVVLYGLSSTTRGSAKEARRARDLIKKARKENKIKDDKVTEENLREAGVSSPEAKELVTAYSINNASQEQAMRSDVMEGFGSNGGEEFMSYLMTGESLLMQGGDDWKKWYNMMETKLVKIQNSDGSWNGHHCITSPVFCTATCLLILSIHKDMQFSMQESDK